MNLDFIESFLDVAEEGSMSKAADKYFISTASVKRQIDSLEQQLNVKLFNRTHQGMSLTFAGEHFYQRIHPLFKELSQLRFEMSTYDNQKTRLNLCTSSVYHFPILDTIVAQYQQKFPNIEINYDSLNPSGWLNSLKKHSNDSCFCIGLSPKELAHIDLNYLALGETPIVCYVSLNHPLAKNERMTLANLANYPLLVLFSIRFHFAQYNTHDYDFSIDTFSHSRSKVINFCNRGGIYISVDKLQEQHPSFTQIPPRHSYRLLWSLLKEICL